MKIKNFLMICLVLGLAFVWTSDVYCKSSSGSSSKKTTKKKRGKKQLTTKKNKDGTSDTYMFKGKTYSVKNYVKDMMVQVKPGKFMMGSPADEEDRGRNETQHEVTISKDFYIGKYEVTQEFYQAVMGKRAVTPFKKGASHPIDNVSWDNAMKFCEKLNSLGVASNGYKFTLPTEAQWEYAARGGHLHKADGPVFAGSDDVDEVAVYASSDTKALMKMHEVAGSKKPNALGIYDMSGNICEWCYDWCDNSDYSPKKITDPVGPPKVKKGEVLTKKIVRGGGYYSFASTCRVAYRSSQGTGVGMKNGFRVVMVHP